MEQDRLDRIFEMQRELQKRIGVPMVTIADPIDTPSADTMTIWHKEHSLALMMEAAELMDWVPWKHWSKQLGNKSGVEPFTVDHLEEVHMEIVDCLHFLINLSLLWGMTPNDLFELYSKKNAVNHDRQKSGSY